MLTMKVNWAPTIPLFAVSPCYNINNFVLVRLRNILVSGGQAPYVLSRQAVFVNT